MLKELRKIIIIKKRNYRKRREIRKIQGKKRRRGGGGRGRGRILVWPAVAVTNRRAEMRGGKGR